MIINFPTETPHEETKNDQGFYQKRKFLTITEIQGFARCPRRYFYSAGCGFRRAGEELARRDTAAHFGTSLGAAIPIILATGDLEQAFAVFESTWGDHVEDEKRNPTTARLVLIDFLRSHPTPGTGLYSILAPPESTLRPQELKSQWEVPFAITIPGLPIPLIGSIDFWSQFRGGEYFVNEIKTSSEMSTRFFTGFKRNPQGMAYVLGMRAHGIPVVGYIMELLSTAKNPKLRTQSIPCRVSDHDLEDFVNWLREMGMRILACEEQGVWPKWPTGCGTYPMFYQPGYFCEYDPMCSVPDWKDMTGFYNVKRHQPYTLSVNGEELVVGQPKTSIGDDE
jgi:hypothetical protein